MNKLRRKQLKEVYAKLQQVHDEIKKILSDEQNYFDNIPENLSDTDKANESEEVIDCLDDISECLSEALVTFDEVV